MADEQSLIPAIPVEPVGPKVYLFSDLDDEKRKERLEWVVQRACERIEDCRVERGIEYGNNVMSVRGGSWAEKRQLARKQYEGNHDHRKIPGTVFYEQNWTMDVPKRFIKLLAAQYASDLLASNPFFAAMPEKVTSTANSDLVKQVESKVQDEVTRSNVRLILVEAIKVALTEGERPIKVTHLKDETTFKGPATVGVDAQGNPIKTPKGFYIFEKDNFIPDQSAQGVMRLEKDLSFTDTLAPAGVGPDGQPVMKSTIRYMEIEMLPQTIVHYDGVYAGGIQSEDFLFPLTVPNLGEADFMCHVYDEPLENIKRVYSFNPIVEGLTASGVLSAVGQSNENRGEVEHKSRIRELFNIHECYIRCDADGDGKEEWIFLVLDYTGKQALYAEYLGNCGMERPPFGLVRGLEAVPGRATGVGVYEACGDKALFIDLQFNRIALKSSKEGSVTFVHRDATEEQQEGLELIVGDKTQYTLRGTTIYSPSNPPIFRVNLNEVDEYGVELLEKLIQTLQMEFGIVSGAEGSSSNLNNSKTATGIRNLERTGNTVQRMAEDIIADDLVGIMKLVTECVLENMPEDEMTFDESQGALGSLNREEIRNLEQDVRLLLTKSRSEESINTSTQAKATILEYVDLPKWKQKLVRSQYIAILKSLDVSDADDKLKDPTDAELKAESDAMTQSNQPPKLGENLQIKFADLAAWPAVQLAALKEMGPAFANLTLADLQTVIPNGQPTIPAPNPATNPGAVAPQLPQPVSTQGIPGLPVVS